jgi:AbrB family looped-hinge helix DNA binding protein
MLKARLSSRGHLALPKEVRDQLDLADGVLLTVRVEGDEVILQKAVTGNWREWEGRFKGSDLPGDLACGRRKELTRDRFLSKICLP